MKALLLTLLCLAPQNDLPTYGKIEQVKDFRRVYVAADTEDARQRIIKALSKDKSLEVVNAPGEAEFFLEYSELSREATVTGERIKERQQRSQMRAYLLGSDKQKIVVWSDHRSRETESMFGMKMYDSGRSESELTKQFLKELKRARGEKK